MKTWIAVSACLVTLTLAGCAGHTHSLIQEESDPDITAGAFGHEGPTGASMVLEFEGKRYEAAGFVINRKQNLAELRREYYPGKHYDRIFSGLNTDHYVYTAQPKLRAGNDAALQCFAVWRAGSSPSGYCVTADRVHIYFRFK